MPDAIRLLDLFAGAGGLTRGFHTESERFRSVAAVEFDAAAAASYAANFGEETVQGSDIQSWLDDGGAIESMADVIIGGPPCQGFSTLGKREVDDERNELWRQYERTILAVKPKYFVVENVAAFSKSPQFDLFKESIESGALRDYRFDHGVLNAADFGAPQARKRAIMVGHHRTLAPVGLPAPTVARSEHKTVRDALAGIPDAVRGINLPGARTVESRGRIFAGSFAASELHLGRNYSPLSKQRFAAIPIGGNRFSLPDDLLAQCWRKHKTGSADVMGRLHWDRPSVTVRTEFFKPEKGRYLHPEADRAITHFEAARLQGFPDSHRFVGSKTDIARQIGNAVPIPLARAIAARIVAAIG